MSGSRRALAVMALVSAAWASAGAAPFEEAVAGAVAPIDFVRDYVTAVARVRHGRGPAPEGDAGNEAAVALGAPRVTLLGGPFHLHPPPALLPVLPLVPLGFRGAALAWLALSLLALGALARLGLELAADEGARTPARAALAFALLALWPPVLHDLAKGQWSILLAALLAAAWLSLERGRETAAGAWLGVAASLKLTPILLLGFLVLRHRRAAIAMAVTVGTLALAATAVTGIEPWRAFFADAPRDVAAWQTWIANTASLRGLLVRLVGGGAYATPVIPASSSVAAGIDAGAALALVLVTAAVTWRTPRGLSAVNERPLVAAWMLLVVVLNPLAWTHTLVMAVVPLAALAPVLPAVVSAGAIVVLTIPRQTLSEVAGATPTAPGRGLLLSMHAAALLIVIGFALARSRRSFVTGEGEEINSSNG
jgi:hypothetical protein